MNIQTAINKGSKTLKINDIKSHQIDSEILMSETLKREKKYLILNSKEQLSEKNLKDFYNLVKSRLKGKPIAYIIGKKEFWKYEFNITKDVLIPRPDTEIIVEQILKITKNKSKLRILDIGVGSGCILLSLLKEKKNFLGIGVDLSAKSIDLCKINSHKLEVFNRVKFYKSNVDKFNYGKYDLIVSNPPYINKLDYKNLNKEVLNFEPKLALDGGLDGLSEIRKVISKSSELIKINGKLVLEIGFNQKKEVKKILRNKGFYINKVLKDYANNDRCIVSTKL